MSRRHTTSSDIFGAVGKESCARVLSVCALLSWTRCCSARRAGGCAIANCTAQKMMPINKIVFFIVI